MSAAAGAGAVLGLLAALLVPPAAGAGTFAAGPTPPAAPGEGARGREPAQAAWPWVAIGRVNRDGGGFCSGTLIAPDRVLTAAHCLWGRRLGRVLPVRALHFLAGYRGGAFLAHGRVRALRTDPALAFDRDGRPEDPTRDWAVLELERPIDGAGVLRPVPIAPTDLVERAVAEHRPLARAGYRRDRQHALSRSPACRPLGLARGGRLLVHDCAAGQGDSGSPILILTETGWAVLAVHTAAVDHGGRRAGAAVVATPAMAAGR
ncbi:MAG TPA: trypsin-like serine protease [Geminicoccaceae bacterium]|nr:trypsin-like serine protease [Geminicoccaceae bacterium]